MRDRCPNRHGLMEGRPVYIRCFGGDCMTISKYSFCVDFFLEPFASSAVGIFEVGLSSEDVELCPMQLLQAKCLRMPLGENFVIIPLPHTF